MWSGTTGRTPARGLRPCPDADRDPGPQDRRYAGRTQPDLVPSRDAPSGAPRADREPMGRNDEVGCAGVQELFQNVVQALRRLGVGCSPEVGARVQGGAPGRQRPDRFPGDQAGLWARALAGHIGHARRSITQDVSMDKRSDGRDAADAFGAAPGSDGSDGSEATTDRSCAGRSRAALTCADGGAGRVRTDDLTGTARRLPDGRRQYSKPPLSCTSTRRATSARAQRSASSTVITRGKSMELILALSETDPLTGSPSSEGRTGELTDHRKHLTP
jgi:hypothetical protein